MKSIALAIGILLVALPLWGYPLVPDPAQTPGVMCSTGDRDYKERRYPERIIYCKRNVSSHFKRKIYANYGIPENQRRNYTIDHFIPLSLGGNNSKENLWPEHKEVKQLRPDLEHDLYLMLRDGDITQEEAVEIIIDAKMNPPVDDLYYH